MATTEEIKQAAKAKGTESLPPAGYGRNETLRMRQDDLDREIEERSNALFLAAIDPAKFGHIDNEIAQYAQRDGAVPHARPDYKYCWVEYNQRNPSDHGQHLLANQQEGWECVHEGDDDAQGVAPVTETPEGYLRWGSVILMRIQRDRYVTIQATRRARQKLIEGQHMDASHIVELGHRYGVEIHTSLPPETIQRAKMQHRMKLTQQQAWQRIDRKLRDGTAHHMPPTPR